MLIAPNAAGTAHAVTLNPPTAEDPNGYRRLIGGNVELGEAHRAAIVREGAEEFGATIRDLRYLGAVENICQIDGQLGHEFVFLSHGRLDPEPAPSGAMLLESSGSEVPIEWRPFADEDARVPLHPACVTEWLSRWR